MLTDEMIRSMKAQMEPSDEVVSDLLAKIAAEMSSPATDNVVSFEAAARKAKHAKTRKNSIWYYGTAVAASVIVLVSTLLLFDSAGSGVGGVKDLFNNVIGGESVLQGEEQPGNVPPVNGGDNEIVGSEKEAGENADGQNAVDSDKETPNVTEGKATLDNTSSEQISQVNHSKPSVKPAPSTPKNDASKDGSKGNSKDSDKNDSKVTPGTSGLTDIDWNREIFSTDAVSNISVSGTNYVVENIIAQSDVGDELKEVTIDLPQTSDTGSAKLRARVMSVKNISSNAMVVLDLEGFKKPLLYVNPDYSPATLGELIEDLGLSGKTSFTSKQICRINSASSPSYENYNTDINEAVWEYLLSDGSAGRAQYSSFTSGNINLMFTSNNNPTNSQMRFGVSDNGYLYVSTVSGNEFTFHIGSGTAKDFIEFVTGESLDSED